MSREPPAVVRLKRKNGVVVVGCDVYIGRAMYQGGWSLPGSKWANPFRLLRDQSNRVQVLVDYENHVRSTPELMGALPELGGKRLGCWCAPLPCHGDVLVRLLSAQSAAPPTEVIRDSAGGLVKDSIRLSHRVSDDDPLWEELGL
jgi:hypothetical protein